MENPAEKVPETRRCVTGSVLSCSVGLRSAPLGSREVTCERWETPALVLGVCR